MQYNVTVVGITKTGQKVVGKNRLQFTTPAPAVRLTSARALGPTRGTANATALPNGYFATVSRAASVWSPGDWGPGCPSQSNADGLRVCRAAWAQYIFTVKRANCSSCKPLVFNSITTRGIFPGLTPDTLVSDARGRKRRACSGRCEVILGRCCPPQYNVTVVGVDKSGRVTKGSNMLQFTTPGSSPSTPPPTPPPPSLKLISARATTPTRGLAVASPQPTGVFVKVHLLTCHPQQPCGAATAVFLIFKCGSAAPPCSTRSPSRGQTAPAASRWCSAATQRWASSLASRPTPW